MYNKKISDLNEQINLHDEEIERLNEIKEQWSEITTISQGLVDINKALAYDMNFVSKVLSGNVELINSVSNNMKSLFMDKSETEDEQKKYQDLQETINDIIESYNLQDISYEQARQQILNTLQIEYPELFAKYNSEIDKVEEIIEKKLENADTTKTTSDNINDTVDKSNEKILESYTVLQEDLVKVFNKLNLMLDEFSKNAQTMAGTISAAISQVQSQINSISSGTVTTTVSVTNTTTDDSKNNKNNSLNKKKTKTAGKSHSGLELGYIGEGNLSQDKKDFKYIALSELSDNEIVRVLQKGEGVVTEPQVSQIMDNFRKITQAKLPTIIPNNTQANQSVSFNGDIVINNPIGDTQKLAREIKQNFGNTLLQELYK